MQGAGTKEEAVRRGANIREGNLGVERKRQEDMESREEVRRGNKRRKGEEQKKRSQNAQDTREM